MVNSAMDIMRLLEGEQFPVLICGLVRDGWRNITAENMKYAQNITQSALDNIVLIKAASELCSIDGPRLDFQLELKRCRANHISQVVSTRSVQPQVRKMVVLSLSMLAFHGSL
eukprot:2577107-Amphidinium_carterae.1